MWSIKARNELDGLLATLRNDAATVPPRAATFHLTLRELEVQIRNAIPFWRPWIGDENVERFRDRAERLDQIAEPLAVLIDGVTRLEAEISGLDDQGGEDPELDAWLGERRRDWLSMLRPLGANCDRESEVSRDQGTLAAVESAVRLHEEAIEQLREAGQVTGELRTDVHAATLIALLPQLRAQLFGHGATADWIKDVKQRVEPLKKLIPGVQVQDPPPELHDFSSILTEARSWSRELDGEMNEELEHLRVRGFRPVDWNPREVQALRTSAVELRQQLIERARQVRVERFDKLEDQMKDLRRASGPQPKLDAQLETLRQWTPSTPHDFAEWLEALERVRSSFTAIAHLHGPDLDLRLRESVATLEAQLHELEIRSLSDEVRRELAPLALDLARPGPSEAEAMLRRLREIAEIGRRLDELIRLADRDDEEIDILVRDLEDRHAKLVTEARRIKRAALEWPRDLSHRIGAVSRLSNSVSIPERRQRIAALVGELDALDQTFVERCRTELAREVLKVQRAVQVLQRAGTGAPAAECPVISEGASPQVAAQALIDAAKRYRILLLTGRKVLRERQSRAGQLRCELAGLPPRDLTPAERQTAERLLRQLDAVLASTPSSVFESVEKVSKEVRDGEAFLFDLRQEEITAREGLTKLRDRLEELRREQLDGYCPEWTERVTALIYGVPKEPRQWSAVHYQLDVAAELLGRVETHAGRLAADDVVHAEHRLEQWLRSVGEQVHRARVETLLAELRACSAEVLPPADLRARLLAVSRELGRFA